jgi:hypothetical protein
MASEQRDEHQQGTGRLERAPGSVTGRLPMNPAHLSL